MTTSLTQKVLAPFLIRISGPNGSAEIAMTEAWIDSIRNKWHSFQFPLEDSAWELKSGTWQGLLQQVFDVKLYLEFYDGTAETMFFDNFCLTLLTGNKPNFTGSSLLRFYPNPTKGEINLQHVYDKLTLFDLHGKEVKTWKNANRILSLHDFPNGVYYIRFLLGKQLSYEKLMIEK